MNTRFVAEFIWKSRQNKDNRNITGVSVDQEYLLCFSKRAGWRVFDGSKRNTEAYSNTDNDPRGDWTSANMVGLATKDARPNLHYDLINPSTGKNYGCPPKGWRYDSNTMRRLISEDRILWPSDDAGRPRRKSFISDISEVLPGFSSVIKDGIYTNTATRELLDIFEGHVFDFSKPKELLKILFQQTTSNDSLVLDFFAGSGTTAQAVMELNLEDGGNRQCICVQMPELLEETGEAYKAGYRTIADITRARIEKVIAKLKAENPIGTEDLACANFTLAPSNFKVWRGGIPDVDALRKQLQIFQSAEKGGVAAKPADQQTAMLAELLLKQGLGALGVHAVSKPKQIAGVTVNRVLMKDDRQMWLCFEPYNEKLKDEIVKARPAQVVMLNSCFTGAKADELLANLQLELQGLDIGLLVI